MARKLAHNRALCACLVMALASGCSSYRTIPPPDAGSAFGDGRATRVTLDGGERVALRGMHVDADSVRGLRDGAPYAVARGRVVAFEDTRIDPPRTILVLGGIACGVGLVIWALANQSTN